MTADNTELTFVRCPSCRSLVPAVSTRCRMCGSALEAQGAAEEKEPDQQQRSGRVRQRTMSQPDSDLAQTAQKVRSDGEASVPSQAVERAPAQNESESDDSAGVNFDPLSEYLEEVEVAEPQQPTPSKSTPAKPVEPPPRAKSVEPPLPREVPQVATQPPDPKPIVDREDERRPQQRVIVESGRRPGGKRSGLSFGKPKEEGAEVSAKPEKPEKIETQQQPRREGGGSRAERLMEGLESAIPAAEAVQRERTQERAPQRPEVPPRSEPKNPPPRHERMETPPAAGKERVQEVRERMRAERDVGQDRPESRPPPQGEAKRREPQPPRENLRNQQAGGASASGRGEQLVSQSNQGDDRMVDESEEIMDEQQHGDRSRRRRRDRRKTGRGEWKAEDETPSSPASQTPQRVDGIHRSPDIRGRLVGWLVSFSDPDGFAIELREGKFFITASSLKDTDLIIDDSSVSTPHAMATVNAIDGFKVQDLMSEQGIFIKRRGTGDYKRGGEIIRVAHGDWVRFGTVEFLASLINDVGAA